YAFLIECEGSKPPEESLCRLLNELDARLHALNLEYAQKRESRRLAPPVLWVMRPGWFDRKASAALRRGARDAQFKAQLLSHAPEDPAEIMQIIEQQDK
ncbi:MAG TPA: GH3 auxin-responsive promoter family protein, partial [Candidatus Binatia bacterium]|nr:GH3 auxin-responsive promoter family protein [Candidatus Binatia bacterium]